MTACTGGASNPTDNPMSQLKPEVTSPRWSRTPSPYKDPDAGLKDIDYYQRRLPPWRYAIRQHLIPIVRLETEVIAKIQATCRSPLLDSYFAMTANLGTHTFFMAALPICFWCGYPTVGVALIQMLALGVYWSGYLKDLLCIPRPLSPPLQRITMSGSAALEYGFPSTHSTNAVSVTLFCLYHLHTGKENFSPLAYYSLQAALYLYAISISFGRIYCGMHGFFDVIIGGLVGALITWLRVVYGTRFDEWIVTGNIAHVGIASAILLLAVKFHPEPADNCPCFDDSVAFTGVLIGIEFGVWDYARRNRDASSFDAIYLHTNDSFIKATARVVSGIAIIFMWRAAMKPMLLRCLPPIFRFVDHRGLRLPRRYFLQARDYKRVPTLRSDDNVLPPAREIPGMLSNLPNPRKRTVSVGPQSEADVREFIANREQKRRNSRSERSPGARSLRRRERSRQSRSPPAAEVTDDEALNDETGLSAVSEATPQHQASRQSLGMNAKHDLLTPPPSDRGASSDSGREEERENQKMFAALEKPRIRYDVEVVTKLVVYAGIAWLSCEGNPQLFSWVGLG